MSVAASTLLRPAQRDPLVLFLLFSLLLHLILLLLWPQFKRAQAPPQEQLTAVELLPPEALTPPQVAQVPPQVKEPEPPKEEQPQEEQKPPPAVPEQQIVSVPDEVNEQVPDKTRFLSDRNTAVKEQTVAVGTPLTKPPEEKRQQTPEKADPNTVQQKKPTQLALNTPEPSRKPPVENPLEKALKDAKQKRSPMKGDSKARKAKPQLFARPDDLLAKGWLSTDGDAEDEETRRVPPSGNELLAMAPPPARENFLTMPGPRGTLDYLPDVRKGNLTFLNTKASRFAPFVRRVAQRVFQHLLIRQRRNLQVDDVVAARNYVQIQAKLDDKGDLRGVTLHTRSGSYAVDESLLDACQQGAWDENPPPEAKSDDGFYHFIFRSRLNARFDASGLRGILTYLEVGLV